MPTMGLAPDTMKIALSVSEKERAKGSTSPYFLAMVEAGAKPEELQLVSPADAVRLRAEDFDGILFAGGDDVDPAFYNENIKYPSVRVDRDRDLFEFGCLDRARRAHLPVLGICRGAQMINVKFGGSLYQDLKSEWTPEDETNIAVEHKQPGNRADRTHGVTATDADARLAQAIHGNCRVNSMHHQAIRVVGRGLRVSARSEDGLVEALESADGSFMLAVQWHPEELVEHVEQRKIFEMFIDSCRAHVERRRVASPGA
ncbi:MAG: gamma-glutamyl-gamma-aminobutyrate hydrolase family protein [Terriglobia bacterium]